MIHHSLSVDPLLLSDAIVASDISPVEIKMVANYDDGDVVRYWWWLLCYMVR